MMNPIEIVEKVPDTTLENSGAPGNWGQLNSNKILMIMEELYSYDETFGRVKERIQWRLADLALAFSKSIFGDNEPDENDLAANVIEAAREIGANRVIDDCYSGEFYRRRRIAKEFPPEMRGDMSYSEALRVYNAVYTRIQTRVFDKVKEYVPPKRLAKIRSKAIQTVLSGDPAESAVDKALGEAGYGTEFCTVCPVDHHGRVLLSIEFHNALICDPFWHDLFQSLRQEVEHARSIREFLEGVIGFLRERFGPRIDIGSAVLILGRDGKGRPYVRFLPKDDVIDIKAETESGGSGRG